MSDDNFSQDEEIKGNDKADAKLNPQTFENKNDYVFFDFMSMYAKNFS